jgi:hypothetical protein
VINDVQSEGSGKRHSDQDILFLIARTQASPNMFCKKIHLAASSLVSSDGALRCALCRQYWQQPRPTVKTVEIVSYN